MSDAATNGQARTPPIELSDQFRADAARLVRRYPVARSALLPLLHLVQAEHGYVSEAGVAFCAAALDLTKAEVGAVATFYTMFKREPVGDYLLSVCTNPTCQVAGAQVIFERYREALGGDLTDPETGVSIEQAECLGICDAAPVVQVNYEMYGPVTDEEADRLLDGCRKGEPPVSTWSGEPAPTFVEVERELSGADDAFGDALVEAARHSITGYENPPAYKTGETDIPVTHPGGDRAGHGGELFLAAFEGRSLVQPSEVDAPAADDGRGAGQVAAAADTGEEHARAVAERDDAEDAGVASGTGDGGIPEHAEPAREGGSDVGGAVLHGRVVGAPEPGEDEGSPPQGDEHSTDAAGAVVTDSQLVEQVGDDRADAAVVAPDHQPDDVPDQPPGRSGQASTLPGRDVTDEVAPGGDADHEEAAEPSEAAESMTTAGGDGDVDAEDVEQTAAGTDPGDPPDSQPTTDAASEPEVEAVTDETEVDEDADDGDAADDEEA